MSLKDWLKGLLENGIRIGYSNGPAFDPAEQDRTDGVRDISEKKQKEADNVDNRKMA